jgi:small conductance mechanosensitive channel
MRLVFALMIFVVGLLASRWIVNFAKKRLNQRNADPLLVNFLASILYWTLLLLVLILSLNQLGVNTTAFVALLGAAALAVGVALQDSLKNFASGVLLVIFRPFSVGHYVDASGTSGIVEEITLFTTLMRTGDNRSVIVPNGSIYDGNIINYSARDTRRIDLVFGIGYDDDLRTAREIMEDVIAADERILVEPPPEISVRELADSSVNFNVRPWVNSEDYWTVKSDVIEKVKLAFDKDGITIPYPQLDIHTNGAD